MTEINDMRQCPRLDLPRVDTGCLHCGYSVKLGGVWLCVWKKVAIEAWNHRHEPTWGDFEKVANGVKVAYMDAPEPIVRCRDCIGLVETWDGWECEQFSGEYHRAEPDGFCAWGERREEDE